MTERSISDQICSALNAATYENGYPHEYSRSARDIVLEIHEWSGIVGFDPESARDIEEGVSALEDWREKN